MKRLLNASLMVVLMCVGALCTTVTSTTKIVGPDGQPFNGTITLQLPFAGVNSQTNQLVLATPVTANVFNGVIIPTMTVTGNDIMSPAMPYSALYTDSFGAPVTRQQYYITGATFDVGSAPATPNFLNTNVQFSLITKGPRPWADVIAWGADPTGAVDSYAAIQNAINFACTGTVAPPVNATCTLGSSVLIPAGSYKTTGCILTYADMEIHGAGMDSAEILKSNNATCTAGSIAAPARVLSDNYGVDAIIAIVHPVSDYAYHWAVKGLSLECTGTQCTYGIYSPRSSQSEVSSLYIFNVGTGFYANDDWLMSIHHTTVDTANFGYRWADDGSGNGTGTTVTLENVYAENIALSCYNIFGLQYSSFNNTACDNLNIPNVDNANVNLSYAAYGFNSSTNITLNGAGAEVIHGTVLSSQASVLTINAMRALAVTGYTSASGNPAYILITTNGSVDITASTFDPMTSSGSFFNLLTQLGGMLTARSTLLPSGGNTFNSFSGGSAIINLNAGVMTLTSSSGVTTISPTSASFGAGATFAGNIIPSVNGGFNSGGPSNGWLNSYQFYHHIIETTAPSSGGGQEICYGDSTAHSYLCSYNAGTFMRMMQVVTATLTTTAAATDNVTVTGMTTTGHCDLTPTNTGAAGGIASVFISAKASNQITVTHTATAGWTFDVVCTPQ